MIWFDRALDDLMVVNASVFGTGHSPYSYMRSLGIRGTILLQGSLLDTANYLTTAQINTAYDANWDVASRGYIGRVWETSTDVEITNDVNQNRSLLESNGWTRAKNILGYSEGKFTLDDNATLAESIGVDMCRKQNTLTNTQYMPTNLYDIDSMYAVNTGVSAADVTAQIDNAIAERRMFSFHVRALNTPETSTQWDPAKFKTVIDHLWTKMVRGEIDVDTASQWRYGLTNSRRVNF